MSAINVFKLNYSACKN